MKVKLNKKRKFIIFLILVLVVLASILGVALYKANAEKRQTAKGRTVEIDTKEDGVLNLGGFGVFFSEYSGQYKSSDIANKLGRVVDTHLPQIYNEVKDFDEAKMQSYYKEKETSLKKKLGVAEYKEFRELIDVLLMANLDLNTHYRLDIVKDSFKNKSDRLGYAYVEFEVTYKSEDKIKLAAYISKAYANSPEYSILAIKDVEKE